MTAADVRLLTACQTVIAARTDAERRDAASHLRTVLGPAQYRLACRTHGGLRYLFGRVRFDLDGLGVATGYVVGCGKADEPPTLAIMEEYAAIAWLGERGLPWATAREWVEGCIAEFVRGEN